MNWRLFNSFVRLRWWYWIGLFLLAICLGDPHGTDGARMFMTMLVCCGPLAHLARFKDAAGFRPYRMLPVSGKVFGRTLWCETVLLTGGVAFTGVLLRLLLQTGSVFPLDATVHPPWFFATAALTYAGTFFFLMAPLIPPASLREARPLLYWWKSAANLFWMAVHMGVLTVLLLFWDTSWGRRLIDIGAIPISIVSFLRSGILVEASTAGSYWQKAVRSSAENKRGKDSFLGSLFPGAEWKAVELEAKETVAAEAAESSRTANPQSLRICFFDQLMSSPYGAALFASILPLCVFGGFALLVGATDEVLSVLCHPALAMVATIWLYFFVVMPWLPSLRAMAALPVSRTRLMIHVFGVPATGMLPLLAVWILPVAIASVPPGLPGAHIAERAVDIAGRSLGIQAALLLGIALALRWNVYAGQFVSLSLCFLFLLSYIAQSTSGGGSVALAVLAGIVYFFSGLAILSLLHDSGEPFRRKDGPFEKLERMP